MLVLHDDISTGKRCVAGEIVVDGAYDATMTDGQMTLTIVTSGSNTHLVVMHAEIVSQWCVTTFSVILLNPAFSTDREEARRYRWYLYRFALYMRAKL